MNHGFGQLHIKKRSFPQWLCLAIFALALCMSFLIDTLNVPSFIKYSVDVMWVVLLFMMIIGKRIQIKKNVTLFTILVFVWLIYVTFVYLFNYQSIFYFLWGIRNNFRFYAVFFAFATFLEEDDVYTSLRFVDVLFWINIPVTLFQFFVLGYKQDYLGGIFGVSRGCNAFTTILFALTVTISLIRYFDGKENGVICLLKSGVALIFAAMAELKFFFLLFVIMVILTMVMTKFSWKKLVVLILFAILLSFAGTILTNLFGSNDTLSFQRIIELITSENYATGEDLGRFTAIPNISRKILTRWYERLFGMGIGNCDTSAFAICNTPFYQTYEYLHYTWFSSAFLFLETGYVGLIFNLIFYFLVGFLAIKKIKSGKGNKLFCQIAVVFAVLCLILTFYNSALRKEVGYIAYFSLALPFIGADENDNEYMPAYADNI